jgi:L-lactate dehydrogenase complex protein LldE
MTPHASFACRPPSLEFMKVALFIPCFIDAFYPEVGIATLELLERFGIEVDYPLAQTCCGQPMANSGAQAEAAGAEQVFVRNFAGYDYIVGPSASCIHHVRAHLNAIGQTDEVKKVRASAWELVEFLHDVVGARAFPWAEFPYRVGLHTSCSALRHLKEASMSEIAGAPFSKPLALLEGVKGIRFVAPARPDECCGFGGTFSVTEEPVSVRMGQDKVRDHLAAGAQYIVSGDMSCLMHQQGCAERMGAEVRFIHIAQVLNGARA